MTAPLLPAGGGPVLPPLDLWLAIGLPIFCGVFGGTFLVISFWIGRRRGLWKQ